MNVRHTLLAIGVVLGSLLRSTGAIAAAPSNDVISGATSVGAIPFAATLDTTQATTDADDAALNANCGAPATDASVWYVVAGTGSDLSVDVSGSDYSAGVLVGVGSPGSLTIVTCGPGSVAFLAEAGQNYYILAIDDQYDGGNNGGQLQINVDVPPPAPQIDLTVDAVGKVNAKSGTAVVSGTATCTATGVQFGEIYGDVAQRAGRTIIRGYFYAELICDGATHSWTADVNPENGLFAGGKANVGAGAFACTNFACGEQNIYRTVRLKGGK